VREVAHSRAGEKGDVVFVSVIAYREADYPLLARELTVERVRDAFGSIVEGYVERFEVPKIGALNFALHRALGGGRAVNVFFEESGKALSSRMLAVEIHVDDDFVTRREHMLGGGS
jgi:hypothetical protein